MQKLSRWLLVALAGGALLAGCGSSSSTSSTQTILTSSQGTSPATTASTPATTSSGSTTGAATTTATPKTPQQEATSCKQAVQAQKTLSPSAKAKLEAICEKGASGNAAAQHKAAQEACVELVNASHIPAGAARERALAICRAP
jgi:hypothetical protein